MLGLSKSMSLRPRTAVGLFPSTRPSGVIVSPKSLVQTKCSSSSGSKNGRVAITTQGGEGVFGSGGPMKMSPDRNPCSSVGLRRELMPKHVAAILDGNRRWAQLHGKELDYDAFCYGYLDLADLCIKWGIPTLTCFIFSTENWKRTKARIYFSEIVSTKKLIRIFSRGCFAPSNVPNISETSVCY
uniref:Alkyl transferase n=1 Tax=Opuntia streptacantha TaxID=393608 RepID=A0A7C9ETX8_OPUST